MLLDLWAEDAEEILHERPGCLHLQTTVTPGTVHARKQIELFASEQVINKLTLTRNPVCDLTLTAQPHVAVQATSRGSKNPVQSTSKSAEITTSLQVPEVDLELDTATVKITITKNAVLSTKVERCPKSS